MTDESEERRLYGELRMLTYEEAVEQLIVDAKERDELRAQLANSASWQPNLRAEIVGAKAQLERYQHENGRLSLELEAKNREGCELRATIESLKAKLDLAEGTQILNGSQVDYLVGIVSGLRADNSRLQAEIERLTKDYELVKKGLEWRLAEEGDSLDEWLEQTRADARPVPDTDKKKASSSQKKNDKEG